MEIHVMLIAHVLSDFKTSARRRTEPIPDVRALHQRALLTNDTQRQFNKTGVGSRKAELFSLSRACD